jgi:hypothetical protein
MYIAIAVVAVAAVVMLGRQLLVWRRNEPLRRELTAQPAGGDRRTVR